MPSRDKLVQIVITRKGKDKFKVTKFDKRECVGGDLMSGREAAAFVSEALPRLVVTPSWDE